MGLLTKLGLVEEVPTNNYDEAVEEYSYEGETVEAELESSKKHKLSFNKL